MKLLTISASILLALSGLFFFMTNHDVPEERTDILATINGSTIKKDAFRKTMSRRMGDYSSIKKRRELLDEMVQFEVSYAAAVKQGIDKDPLVTAAFRRMVVNRFLGKDLDHRLEGITVTEDEIRHYHTEHMDTFTSPEMAHVAIIKISLPSNVSKQRKAQLLQKAQQARNEAAALPENVTTLAAVAVKYSDDPVSRYRGGDAGWINTEVSPKKWEQVVINTIPSLSRPGELSSIVVGKEGFYLIKLMEIRESASIAIEKVSGKITHLLVHEKRKQVIDDFYAETRKNIDISVDYDAVKDIKQTREKVSQQSPGQIPGMPQS